MDGQIRFALNHMVAPRLDIASLARLARSLDFDAIEIRNDLPGVAIQDGTPPERVAEAARAQGVEILTINALQRFNDWNATREAEAGALIDYAGACGAKGLVLCPVNDPAFRPFAAARREGLRTALARLAPMLRTAGITGLVEPLGFEESSLRSKREAVEAIDEVGGQDVFRLVHDTFHHHLAGEDEIFADRTGLVHVSGVEDPELPVSEMRDTHRVLVGPRDRLGNAGQIRRLRQAGYAECFSFEPFAASVHALPDARAALADSIAAMTRDLRAAAA